MEDYQYVILGDEPAGLWLARRLWEQGKAVNPPPKIAVIHWTDLAKPTLFPSKLASPFQIPTPKSDWSADIVTPNQTFRWDDASLCRRFPKLSPQLLSFETPPGGFLSNQGALKNEMRPTKGALNEVRSAIKNHPELFAFASGLWKAVGRSRKLAPETIVWGSLFCTKLFDWEPLNELPSEVHCYSYLAQKNFLQEAKITRQGNFLLQFSGQPAITTEQLFLNVSLRRLALLSAETPDLWDLIHADGSLRAFEASYPLNLRVEAAGLPQTLQPLTILFDTEEIPDLLREVWCLRHKASEKEHELTLWADSSRELSLEAVLQAFREGMGKLNRLFPFLSRSLLEIGTPLSMETCFDDSQRAETLTSLDSLATELYDFSALRTDTRHPAVHGLFPFLHCHLPYPIGPLWEAQRLLEKFQAGFDKKIRAQEKAFQKSQRLADKEARAKDRIASQK